MSKYLKKQQQLIQAATESDTLIIDAQATPAILPRRSATKKTDKPRRIVKGKHLSGASASQPMDK